MIKLNFIVLLALISSPQTSMADSCSESYALLSDYVTGKEIYFSKVDDIAPLAATEAIYDKVRKNLEAYTDDKSTELFKAWEKKIGVKKSSFYRGMYISGEELGEILREGMKMSKINDQYKEIYGATEPFTPLTYAMALFNVNGPGRGAKKNLAVFFEIENAGLQVTHEAAPYEKFLKVSGDIPASSLKRVLIFDPAADLTQFPFVEVKFPPASIHQ